MKKPSFVGLLLELPAFEGEEEEEKGEEVGLPSSQREALSQELVVQLLLNLPAFQKE